MVLNVAFPNDDSCGDKTTATPVVYGDVLEIKGGLCVRNIEVVDGLL
jgi:hypothetical protein